MKNLHYLIFTICLIVVHSLAAQDLSIEAFSKKYDTPLIEKNEGIGLLIKNGKGVQSISLGNHELNENSVFNIGSTTKTMTAILILQEMEKGNIKPSDSIGLFIDPISNVDGSITIDALLSHETGLDEVVGKNIEDIFYSKKDASYNQDLLLQVQPRDSTLIGKFDYCNTNYLILGKILESLTDQSYNDLLRERIFTPLNMVNSYPYVHKNMNNLAKPFYKGKEVTEYLDYRYFSNIANSAGSVASTLADMSIFFTSLFETEILLKKSSLDLMLTAGNTTYGYGIFKPMTKDQKYYGHGGNNIGYSFRNGYNPDTKELYLLFSNDRTIPLRKSVIEDVHKFLDGKSMDDFKSVNLDRFNSYIGNYIIEEANLELEILKEGDKIYLYSQQQGIKSELTQKDEYSLTDTIVGATLSINETDTRNLTFSQNGFTTIMKRLDSK